MADTLNFKKGVASALPAASNGQILFTTDTNELYIDDAGSHKQINANNAKSADKLNTNAGDSNTPVYFSNGKPVACTGLDLDTSGNAATATKLATARTITTNLASTAAASFDGSADATPGVSGILPINHGGTGASDALSGYYNLAWRGTPTSLNDASSIGFYKINPDVTNAPYDVGMWGACMLLTDDAKTTGNTSGSVWQMAFTTASTDLHLRCRTNGTDWQGWHKLLTSNNYSDYCAPREHTHSYLPLSGGTVTGGLTAWGGITLTGSDLILGCYNGNTKNDSSDIVYQYSNATEKCRIWTANEYTSYCGPNWRVYKEDGTALGSGHLWASGESITGAVWNDYAECRESDCYEAGYVLSENGDDTLSKTNERLAPFAGVSSDTWGFSQGETDKAKTHIAVAGRVLVHPFQDRNNYKPGDCVCAAPGGTVDIMTREEVREWPDRIVGTVSCVPEYETWGGGKNADRNPVQVNGRIWIKVK